MGSKPKIISISTQDLIISIQEKRKVDLSFRSIGNKKAKNDKLFHSFSVK